MQKIGTYEKLVSVVLWENLVSALLHVSAL